VIIIIVSDNLPKVKFEKPFPMGNFYDSKYFIDNISICVVSYVVKIYGSSELSGGTKIACERSVCEFTTEDTENTEIH